MFKNIPSLLAVLITDSLVSGSTLGRTYTVAYAVRGEGESAAERAWFRRPVTAR